MNPNDSCVPFDSRELAADRQRGGVWLLADVVPELLAKYQVSGGVEEQVERRKAKVARLALSHSVRV